MDRASHNEDIYRGPSGAEDVSVLRAPVETSARRRALGAGLLVAGVLVLCVVFAEVPAPAATGANTHGAAPRCVDNSACAGEGEVGDCCPGPNGKDLACCRDPTNIATVSRTVRGACDDNSACAALGLEGACCPDATGSKLGCCRAMNNTVRAPHAVSASCALNAACKATGLAVGNCCPTDDGTVLGCCPPVAARARRLRR
mmetsp:Transcript_6693/g.21066  ORF Transcript_6693/g.21066 Transcript_6693/m.21066 type:complete len:201 (+) Transcript_6693:201-803(+)